MTTKTRNAIKSSICILLGVLLGSALLLTAVAANWEFNFAPKELSNEVFLEKKAGLSQVNVNMEYLDATKNACREAVERYYGGEVLDDYIIVWSDNGLLTLSYYYQDARSCYRITSKGNDNTVACAILNYETDYIPSATFNGETITFNFTLT